MRLPGVLVNIIDIQNNGGVDWIHATDIAKRAIGCERDIIRRIGADGLPAGAARWWQLRVECLACTSLLRAGPPWQNAGQPVDRQRQQHNGCQTYRGDIEQAPLREANGSRA
jgi:hypothetical protein